MKEEIDLQFIKEVIDEYSQMADEHERIAKGYREVSNFWRKRYNIIRTDSPLEPLFVDDAKVKTTRKVTFIKKVEPSPKPTH